MTEDLEQQGLIKKLPVDQKKVQDTCDLAHRDIKTAHYMLDSDYDWAYTIAYNAVLQAGRALMFLKRLSPYRYKPAYFCGEICGTLPG